jgi:predicted nucleic acid-binding protein
LAPACAAFRSIATGQASLYASHLNRANDFPQIASKLLCKVAMRALLEEYEAATCSPVVLEVLGGARKEEREEMQEDFSVIPHIQAGPKNWAARISRPCRKALGLKLYTPGHGGTYHSN